jgi:hypothetical protein
VAAQDIVSSQPGAVFAIAWYRPEQWQKLRQISVDRNKLETTHAEWLEIAVKTLIDLKNMGLDVRPVEINVDELARWCKENKRAAASTARSEFAAYTLPQAD